jgi:hypothetical protein
VNIPAESGLRLMFLWVRRLSGRFGDSRVSDDFSIANNRYQARKNFGPLNLICMDYLHGLSVAELLKAARSPIPPEIAITIVVGVLHGLHAAHEACSEQGDCLEIVHRDVTPQNVIVDGTPRVLDLRRPTVETVCIPPLANPLSKSRMDAIVFTVLAGLLFVPILFVHWYASRTPTAIVGSSHAAKFMPLLVPLNATDPQDEKHAILAATLDERASTHTLPSPDGPQNTAIRFGGHSPGRLSPGRGVRARHSALARRPAPADSVRAAPTRDALLPSLSTGLESSVSSLRASNRARTGNFPSKSAAVVRRCACRGRASCRCDSAASPGRRAIRTRLR